MRLFSAGLSLEVNTFSPLVASYRSFLDNRAYHACFAPISEEVIYATGDGLLSSDYRTYPRQSVARPIWPLDPPVAGRLLL